jgi:hypothetical protein
MKVQNKSLAVEFQLAFFTNIEINQNVTGGNVSL